jgi:hypothetical protein
MVVEAGIKLCAVIHDAILVECRAADVEETVDRVRQLMIMATRIVLNDGHMLQVGELTCDIRVDAKAYAHPVHFNEGRDSAVWNLITRIRAEDGYEPLQ